MEEIRKILAGNFARLRAERQLSLDRISEMTGVSKSMLGQIERSESSPSLDVLWKMAKGLGVSLTTLAEAQGPETFVVSTSDVEPVLGDGGRFRVYPLFPYSEATHFEILAIEMDEGSSSHSDAHLPGTVEFMIVTKGRVRVRVGAENRQIKVGTAMRYLADLAHSYTNEAAGESAFNMVMFYPEPVQGRR